MRIIDSRYARDNRRLELAVRLARLQARLSTVCTWTGLSEQRVITLQRSIRNGLITRPGRQRRGPAPRDAMFFFRSASLRAEASAAAVLCTVYRAIPEVRASAPTPVPTVEWGERLCDAYESYVEQVSPPRLTFEHVVLLVNSLATGELMSLEECLGCGAALLIEPVSHSRRQCETCRAAGIQATPDEPPPEVAVPEQRANSSSQGELF